MTAQRAGLSGGPARADGTATVSPTARDGVFYFDNPNVRTLLGLNFLLRILPDGTP